MQTADSDGWSFFIDRGGTFTDVVALDPTGKQHVSKLLSEDPTYDDAALEAMRRLVGERDLKQARIDVVRMGTTVATNALLERRGTRLCLVTTAGFEDLLEIGTQDRPDLFALQIVKPEVLAAEVIGVAEAVSADGEALCAPDLETLRAELLAVRADGICALAVALKNAYRNPVHEVAIGALGRELGFEHVGLSHQVVREINLTARGDTTTADAYLTPILRSYLDRFRVALADTVSVRFMQSNGGLAEAAAFSGKDAILSGPAGGVVACAHVARQAGLQKVIGFDMGGTSTDVCRLDLSEGFERAYERVIAGVRIKAPMMNVVTIAAGGGSVLAFNGRRLTVGPESAGAIPGPVCYRRPGGRLTVTDANAALGRVQSAHFPSCFGPAADECLDVEGSTRALQELAERVRRATEVDASFGAEALAAGFVRIANDNMVRAIREISVARGYDVSEYALLCFGGAGAQHACQIATSLGIDRVLIHPLSGVLSAYGMGLADVVHTGVLAVLQPLDGAGEDWATSAATLEESGRSAVLAQGVAADALRFVRSADLRYRGVDSVLNVVAPSPEPSQAEWLERFEAQHQRLFGFKRAGHPLELVNVRVETIGSTERPPEQAEAIEDTGPPTSSGVARVFFDVGGELGAYETPVFSRRDLSPGASVDGPALITEDVSTVVVDPGWCAVVDAQRNLVLQARAPGETSTSKLVENAEVPCDPVLLEIMGNLYMSIAEQMGATLRRVSLSVNIKERLDFSCAVFDGEGQLVANAPHIPVHLGAMGQSVRAIIAARGDDLRAGDVLLTNDPFAGGSHLPDITLVTPVFVDGSTPAFFVANRGHHADVGGVVPGSMPPFSRSIEEEGLRLHDVLVVRDGRFLEDELVALLGAGEYPVRGIPERIADLQAQVAANAVGVRLLEEMTGRYGFERVRAYMAYVQKDAAAAMREAVAALPDGTSTFSDCLDDGARIAVSLTVDGAQARIDFEGTGGALPGNLNAPRAVVFAAVLYVFRTLVRRPIPLNAGCFEPLEIVIPTGSLLDPSPPSAVVGGNVETSQRIVDVLYGALGNLGAAQGTMNNLTFGSEAFGYYETICGGAGAGLGFDGASAVHTHMTNTRITDPEVLESRYPVVLRAFRVRRGSGGEGVFRGGDGAVRELEFKQPMHAAVLSERRVVAPYGVGGAASGALGRNRLVRDGVSQELDGKVQLDVQAGDVLVVETPGGGGYDPSASQWAEMKPTLARRLFREGRYRGPTAGISLGHVQANLVVLPSEVADAFEAYCRLNPGPCPLIERLVGGSSISRRLAPGADLRTDLPGFWVHTASGHTRAEDLRAVWNDDLVAFLVGCSFSTEEALLRAGVPVRHVEERKNVPMFRTRRQTRRAGPFEGALVVTMRPMPRELAAVATSVSGPYWHGHGGPVHVGDHEALGIADLSAPEWGDAVTIRPGEVPVFWACGVTTQEAVASALGAGAFEQALTHAPGHMFLGDLTNEELIASGPTVGP
jgi:5-oxoprolinase (ATP-hydrolysing)